MNIIQALLIATMILAIWTVAEADWPGPIDTDTEQARYGCD